MTLRAVRTVVCTILFSASLAPSAHTRTPPVATPPAVVEPVMAQPGTYRLKNNRGCLRISEEGGFVFLLPECAADDPIFSVIRDTATHFTMRGRVVEGQSYCSTGGKNVPVGAPRLDYAACKVIDTLPAGATKKPSIPTQQFRVEEIGSRPGWYQIVSDAYGKSRCWDVANPEMSDVYLKPCTNIAAQQFQLLPATR